MNPATMKSNIIRFMNDDDVDDEVLVGDGRDLESVQSSVAMFLYEGYEQDKLSFYPWDATAIRVNKDEARTYISSNISKMTHATEEDAM